MDFNIQFGFQTVSSVGTTIPVNMYTWDKNKYLSSAHHHRVDWEYFGVAFAALGTDGVEYSSKQRAIF